MELESYKNGTLLHIGAQKGEKIPVNGLLCIIGDKTKVDVEAIVNALKEGNAPTAATPVKETAAAPAPTTVKTDTNTSSSNGRISVSPGKKLASEKE